MQPAGVLLSRMVVTSSAMMRDATSTAHASATDHPAGYVRTGLGPVYTWIAQGPPQVYRLSPEQRVLQSEESMVDGAPETNVVPQ